MLNHNQSLIGVLSKKANSFERTLQAVTLGEACGTVNAKDEVAGQASEGSAAVNSAFQYVTDLAWEHASSQL